MRLGVLGGGAWGTALANLLSDRGEVVLWMRDPALADRINRTLANPAYLPGVALDPAIRASAALADLAPCEALLLAVPAQHLRRIADELRQHLAAGTPVVVCAKGIERGSGALMSEVCAAVLPDCPAAVLSGPTFAVEVAAGLPTAVTLASPDPGLGRRLAEAIGRPRFRPYLSDDPVGAQIGGALKNVIAIACGIVEGRGLGQNARAALMTRGLAEMLRFGRARGARPETLIGLSGLGDLTLTCNSEISRNMSLGIAIGHGRNAAEVLGERRTVAEGAATVPALVEAARELAVEMPIALAVDGIVTHYADVGASIEALLARPFRDETD